MCGSYSVCSIVQQGKTIIYNNWIHHTTKKEAQSGSTSLTQSVCQRRETPIAICNGPVSLTHECLMAYPHFSRSLMSILAARLSANPVSSSTSSTCFLKSNPSSMICSHPRRLSTKRPAGPTKEINAPHCSLKPTSSSCSPASPSHPWP